MSFTFKHFHIDDRHCAMKVGTDGVLLGAWTDVNGCKKILDVGAGSGIVSLMLADRADPNCVIDAVECDKPAFEDCQKNFRNSAFAEKLTVFHSDFTDIDNRYDLIVSNPPFFLSSLLGPDDARNTARHAGSLNYKTLIDYARTHLNPHGRLCMITQDAVEHDVMYRCTLGRLFVKRICYVRNRPDSPVKRILWEIINSPSPGDTDTPLVPQKTYLTVRDENNRYSDRYKELTAEYYLNF